MNEYEFEPLEWCGKTSEPPKNWEDSEDGHILETEDQVWSEQLERSRMYVMPPTYDPFLEANKDWQGYQRIVTKGAGETETKVVGSKYSRSKVCAPDKRFASCEQYLSVDSYYKVLAFCKYHQYDPTTPTLPKDWDEWERKHFGFIFWRVKKYGY